MQASSLSERSLGALTGDTHRKEKWPGKQLIHQPWRVASIWGKMGETQAQLWACHFLCTAEARGVCSDL